MSRRPRWLPGGARTDDDALGVAALGAGDAPADPDADLPDDVRPPRANRTIMTIAVTAVVSLGAGIAVSQLVVSPAQRAAEAAPPEAGVITVPVEQRELSTDLTLRGDVLYDDPVPVSLETGDLGGAAIVTGQVPEVGDVVEAGQVILEIAGRPVIVLPGELPIYRTLRVGSSGPDVVQLKEALVALGLSPGDPTSESFDAATAAAVDALYAQSGYAAPRPEEGAEEALRAARDTQRMSEEALSLAQAELDRAADGLPRSERLRHDTAVARAERAVQAAVDGGEGAEAVTQAREELELVRAERAEALARPDLSAEVAARDTAAQALEEARVAVDEAWSSSRTPLPAAEIVYVDTLPRRVDSVTVGRGDSVSGEALTISGATLQVRASVSASDIELITEGMTAYFSVGEEQLEATVGEIATRRPDTDQEGEGDGDAGSGGDRREIVLVPGEITEEQRAAILGSNVRVTIPLESTSGDVLVVPVAALTAGPGGESRVEVDRGEGTEIVVVETGLTAGGYVEVRSSELAAGDLVVVGR
ncbi:hypothetical protein [Georgenia sp. H159]|uniref:hypothetical protein n=1 Tax=Georgenia sp. H159 TaxID=3076115 RepID=UPI002D7978E1|nr:hypothetical protein [Georgenia sp. H159]